MDNRPRQKKMQTLAANSGTFYLGGELKINRLGFGSMQLTGPGVWGPPTNHREAIRVLKHAIDLGINFLDTADSYGPNVAEELICEALHPYPSDLIIATKAGLTRPGPDRWVVNGNPKHLRAACEGSLKRLGVERIDLYQLHRIDYKFSLEDQIGTLVDLQRQGKIRFIGLSEVNTKEIEKISDLTSIATVQNKYNLIEREHDRVLNYCTEKNIGFIPWFPLAAGELAQPKGSLAELSQQLAVSPTQLALAWLLKKSPVVLPIPGTSKVIHLEQNVAAVNVDLNEEIMEKLNQLKV